MFDDKRPFMPCYPSPEVQSMAADLHSAHVTWDREYCCHL